MPKVGKTPARTTTLPAKATGLKIGDKVQVTTTYTVKRVGSGPELPDMIAVEDSRGDRVLNFRKEELKGL